MRVLYWVDVSDSSGAGCCMLICYCSTRRCKGGGWKAFAREESC